jgi:hypothetical protein
MTETPQQRRDRFLAYASAARVTAFKTPDPDGKRAWIEIARSWTAMANEIPPDDY